MATVVVVHGIGRQYEGADMLHTDLAAALRDGVRLAEHIPPRADEIGVAFYGDLFRKEGLKGGPEPDAEDGGVEAELALRWWRAAARMDPENVQSPDDTADARGKTPRAVKSALRALSMSRFATRAAERALLGELQQVRDYLYGDQREPVLARVCKEITDGTRVVVGHSLGSIVAYEALCALPGHGVRALVTLGSPLGIRNLVFERLRPEPKDGKGRWPGDSVRWTNICDPHDVVALEERLGGLFGGGDATITDDPLQEGFVRAVSDRTVVNGWRAHDLGRYLTARATGTAIGEGLTR